MKKQAFVSIFLTLLLLLIITACGEVTKKEAKPSEDWSRGILLGDDAAGAVGIMSDEDSDTVHVIWPSRSKDDSSLRYVKIDQEGQKSFDESLDFDGLQRQPIFIESDGQNLHLIWSSRKAGVPQWDLQHALINEDGEIAAGPKQLVSADMKVGKYVVEPDGSNGVLVAWDSGDQGEVNIIHIDSRGTIINGPSVVTRDGEYPSMSVDPEGKVHLAWFRDVSFYYAPLELEELEAGDETLVVIPSHIRLGLTGDSLAGPVLAHKDGKIHLFWSIHSTTDTEAGNANTEYIIFDEDEVQSKSPTTVRMLGTEDQPYFPYEGDLALSQLVDPPDLSTSNTKFIVNPTIMRGENGSLAVALITEQPLDLEKQLQPVVAVFENGGYAGYTLAGKTDQISDDPALSVDDSGNLHMVWRDGPGGHSVYYATTRPAALKLLDRLGTDDVITAVPEGVMDSFASFAFVPFVGLCWLLPGFLLIGAWSLFKDSVGMGSTASRVLVGAGITIYYFMKVLFLPSIVTYVPFSAWMYIPDSLELLLRIIMPLLIFGIAAFVAFAVGKRYTMSPMIVYLSFVVTDAALSLAVYGVNFQGSF